MPDAVFRWNADWLHAHMGEHYNLCNKDTWLNGEWMKEPDLLVFEHRGLLCAVRRNLHLGTLCGYVRVPEGHPWHGAADMNSPLSRVHVHGGITFADHGDDDNGWYLGFDCGHFGDAIPRGYNLGHGIYRSFGYVHEETLALARAVSEAEVPFELDAFGA